MGRKGRKKSSQKNWGPRLFLPPPSLPWPHLPGFLLYSDSINVKPPEYSRSLGQL